MRDFLSVKQSEGVVFGDIDALNATLLNSRCELSEGYVQNAVSNPTFKGFLKCSKFGNVKVFNSQYREGIYSTMAPIYGSWCDKSAKIIADAMVAGKLVFSLDEFGFYVLTPGKVEVRRLRDMKF